MMRTLRIYSVNNFYIQQVNYINHIIHCHNSNTYYLELCTFDHLLKHNDTTQRYKDLHKDTKTQEMVRRCNNIFFLFKKYF